MRSPLPVSEFEPSDENWQGESPENSSITAPKSLSWPLVFTVLSWAVNFAAIKIAYTAVPPGALALLRWVLMYTCLVVITKASGLRAWPSRENLPKVWLLGSLAMGLYIVIFFAGMSGSTPAEGAILLACAPIFTSIFASIFKQEKFVPISLVGAAFALCGVGLVVFGGGATAHGKVLYNAIVFLSSMVWALSAVVSRPLVAKQTPLEVLTQSMPGALLFLVPYGITSLLQVHPAEWSAQIWISVLHVSLLAGALGFLGFYSGVKQVGASGAMLYQYFVPVGAAVFGYLFLHSKLEPIQIVGMVTVLAGVLFAMKMKQRAI